VNVLPTLVSKLNRLFSKNAKCVCAMMIIFRRILRESKESLGWIKLCVREGAILCACVCV